MNTERRNGANDNEFRLEMFRSGMGFALATLKASMLINGGAAVALLAVLGDPTQSAAKGNALSTIACALVCFSIGTFLGALSGASGYWAHVQAIRHLRKKDKQSLDRVDKWTLCTMSLLILSLLLFVAGVYFSYGAIF